MASGGGCPFLPDDTITYILKRLSLKSIIRLRCVCKRWKNLFKTPFFIAEHLSHSDRKSPFLLLHESDFVDKSSSLRLLNHRLETVEFLCIPSIYSFRQLSWDIVGSCNGLLCVHVYEFGIKTPTATSLFLWNPAIREVREVPHAYDDYRRFCSVAFGFSSVINDYKIVIFPNQKVTEVGEIRHRVAVYSLSTDSWKELDFGPSRGTIDDLAPATSQAVSVDGRIFWFFPFNRLVSFDIATEVVTVTRIPYEYGTFVIGLGVYDNRLAFHYRVLEKSGYDSICVCMTEEVASESGKILKCTQIYRTKQTPYVPLAHTLCAWGNEIVCPNIKGTRVDGGPKCSLYLFDLFTNEERKFNCSRSFDWCSVFNYERSLVSVWSTQAEQFDS